MSTIAVDGASLAGTWHTYVFAFAAPSSLGDFLHLANHAANWLAFAAAATALTGFAITGEAAYRYLQMGAKAPPLRVRQAVANGRDRQQPASSESS